MNARLTQKLQNLVERHQEISLLMSEPSIINQQERFRALAKEYAELEELSQTFGRYQHAQQALKETQAMLNEEDAELRTLAEDEQKHVQQRIADLELELQTLLLPKDPMDERNVFLEIRAGAGGDEAAIFAGDLYRMYSRYAEAQGWRVELMSAHAGEHGGYREIIVQISGHRVYSRLKFESGAHRVQRVPETEAQGRVHTSTCTVAVMPEADEIADVTINPADLRIDTYRASGAGGQHVNRTDSAIRITHIPSGVVVECQDERSQHKNRAKAMSVLKARLLAAEQEKKRSQEAETRRNLVGTGDRSERIRTYNYSQGRVTDHRINLTLYQLTQIMEGELHPITDALGREYQADQLAALAGN